MIFRLAGGHLAEAPTEILAWIGRAVVAPGRPKRRGFGDGAEGAELGAG